MKQLIYLLASIQLYYITQSLHYSEEAFINYRGYVNIFIAWVAVLTSLLSMLRL